MHPFLAELIQGFAIALGVELGGSLAAGLAAGFSGGYPVRTMVRLAEDLKLWALVAALGGTFGPIKNLEVGLLDGQLNTLTKQLLLIAAAFIGAHSGQLLLRWLAGEQP